MKAMVLDATVKLEENPEPLRLFQMEDPSPGAGEVLIHVSACGVCHTELDEIEGRTRSLVFRIWWVIRLRR